jgi:hypothetical protein
MNYVVDFETHPNFTLLVAEETRTTNRRLFEISYWKNDFADLANFLWTAVKQAEVHIGFNNLAFDAQVEEFILCNSSSLKKESGEQCALKIYEFVQHLIELSSSNQFLPYAPWNIRIKNVDMYKLNGWDGASKRSSLKYIQFSMDWEDIVEMPVEHDTLIREREVADAIIAYCINDVRSTKEVYMRSLPEVKMRKQLDDLFFEGKGVIYSHSRTALGKEIFLDKIATAMNVEKRELRKMQTWRTEVELKYAILPQLTFLTKECTGVLEMFKRKTVDPLNMKGAFAHSMRFRGMKISYGVGGVHGAAPNGHYKSGNGLIIRTSDVKSYYPNLTISNEWAPAHIPKAVFCRQYKWTYDERQKIPKKDPRNAAYKEVLNGAGFGLTNEKNSFLYDPLHFLRVTVNGQLGLTKLLEMVCLAIPTAKPLMFNTDGLETLIPEDADAKYMEVCKEWEKLMKLELEHGKYSDIYLTDVNNYIAVQEEQEVPKEKWEAMRKDVPHDVYRERSGKFYVQQTKSKGRFEFHDLPLHKNKSFLILRKAAFNFLVHKVDPLVTLSQNRNIFDWCAGLKIDRSWMFDEHRLIEGVDQVKPLQRVLRYYISVKGAKIWKRKVATKKLLQVHADKSYQTPYCTHKEMPWEERGVDVKWYLSKVNEEIGSVIGPTELALEY